ncbi:VC0807 family protein [Paraburkholderia caribensis]|uniref:VC0807 family protein n=1 Tax=Paraburkholderia caribensis TaxID=75105 RepID=UPI00071FCCFD|nr:VC0807 family protein [Paraburkholderia caribensis]ALP68541.1 hypothetical protein AN416_38095 [Paraburkholderia caribensis]AUT57898.1 hypothetical protein C2L66_39070 [Paraburkholderia caribensis]
MGQSSSGSLERATRHVAVFSLVRSMFISMVAPSIIYHYAAPHFASSSLCPLGLSGLPPILALAHSVFRQKAVDFLGLIAAENVIVDMLALVLSHTEKGALAGRALENPILALIFALSILMGKPLVLSMSRQLSTGNDPHKRAAFDAVAMQPYAMRVYRFMTWVWIIAFLIKSIGNYTISQYFSTREFLIFNPIWSLATDVVLLTWTMLYGRAKLVSPPVRGSGDVSSPQLKGTTG